MNPVDTQMGAMIAHLWMRYELGPTRCTGADGYHDCSGLADYGMNEARGVLGLEAIPCWQADTFQFEALLRAHPELRLTREQARRTRGAWCGWNRNGEGHMGTSMGDGRTIEARSHALDLGIFTFDGRNWEWYMMPPGVTVTAEPPAPLPGPTTTTEGEAMGMVTKRVPGTHVQSKPPWQNRYPFVGAIQHEDDRTDIVGFNGASVQGGHDFNGMSVRSLGVLHAPISELDFVDDDPSAPIHAPHHRCVGLAGDGGTFVFDVVAHYL